MTGSASGIGLATRKMLEAAGDRVIGVDLAGQEIDADLSRPEDRAQAVDSVVEACDGVLDGIVLAAGVGPDKPPRLIGAVNYFGVIEVADGLLEALARGSAPSAVVIGSNSGTITPMEDIAAVEFMLEGDEAAALDAIADQYGAIVYGLSKLAVGRAVRHRARRWGAAGVRLNAIAPGPVSTPLLDGIYETEGLGDAVKALPIPYGAAVEPEQIAAIIGFLMSDAAAPIHGSVVYADGGTDALVRPDSY